MSRRTARQLVVDLDPTSAASRADPQGLARAVGQLLTTSLRSAGPAPGPVPVTRLRHLNLRQLAGVEISGGPMQVVNDLSNPGSVFVYTLVAGDCTLRCADACVRLVGGQFTLLTGGRTVQTSHRADYRMRSTRFPAAQLTAEMADWAAAELLPVDAEHGPGMPVSHLQEALLAAGANLTPQAADAWARALACTLADALRSVLPQHAGDVATSQAEHHKRRIRAHVRQHLANPLLDVASIAAGVSLSVGHLHRLFADEPLSLAAWIQAERLDACRDALLAAGRGGRSLTGLALAWGFRDPAHFSRSFKRRFGVTPSALRGRDDATSAAAAEPSAAAPVTVAPVDTAPPAAAPR